MGKRILLLEKERNLAHFLSLELQKEQYRVDLVEEGQKALSMALQTDYDLILLNARLGDMTAQDFGEAESDKTCLSDHGLGPSRRIARPD